MIFLDVVEYMVLILYYLLKLLIIFNIELFDGKGFNKFRVMFCYGFWGKGVDLIGFGWVGLFISWYLKYVL